MFHPFSHNRGTNAARNAAISIAKGKWCIILDSDDYWENDSLTIIDKTIVNHPNIRHFCFAPDDMLQIYGSNPLLQGSEEKILPFEDFLMERIRGDFVHVMQTEIIRQYPFDEQLRIYEGVFFLSFYKEAQYILFTNKVVSHRERGRKDSVTQGFIRVNNHVIKRTIQAEELFLTRFTNDLSKTNGGEEVLWRHLIVLLDNYLLLQEYRKANGLICYIHKMGLPQIPLRHTIIYKLRLGRIYFLALRFYLFAKYNILKKKLI